jgi:hypothetical protein
MNDWKKKKVAVYLRRSEGESGSTQDQLDRILPKLKVLEKEGKIAKLNKKIVGRDITKKKRFDRKTDLVLEGDIFNEGEGASGFKFADRPVLAELIKRTEAGEYDGILVESMNRVARDFAGLSRFLLPLWRDQNKEILSLIDGQVLNKNRLNEAIINSQMTWGGISKLEEIEKAEEARTGTTLDTGYFKGSQPEWLGKSFRGVTQQFIDYRKAYALMKAAGLNKEGNLNNAGALAKMLGKTYNDRGSIKGDNKWANLWWNKMSAYDEAGALENWLNAYESITQFIRNAGTYPKATYKTQPVKNIIRHTTGFMAYPAGVNPAGSQEFVIFPDPMEFGLQRLADEENVLNYPDWQVIREPLANRVLLPIQTQPRSRKTKK